MSLNGIDTTIVFPEDRFMERLFTPEIADFYEGFYKDKGITILKEDTVVGFEGEGSKVSKVWFKVFEDKLDAIPNIHR